MPSLPAGFLWLPLGAVAAHLIEEFVWPGGFGAWYRRYRPERAASVTTSFLVIINVVLCVLAVLPPLLGPTPRAFGLWAVVTAIGAVNALFHLSAVVRTRVYSPGVVTGTVLYLPLAILGFWRLLDGGLVSNGTALEALIIGAVFHIWSAWNHKRRALAPGTS